MSAPDGRRIELSPEVLFQDIEGEAVLLDLATGKYFGLNEVATRFWAHAAENPDLEAVLAGLLDEFEVEADALKGDVAALLDEMVEAGLVRLVDDAEPGD